MIHCRWSPVVVAIALAASSPALADSTAGDAIVLKSGGLYRGTLIDVVPNDHARIRLESGEIENVAWGEIDHVEKAPAPKPYAPPPASPPDAPIAPTLPKPSPVAPPRVLVEMSGSPDATLERRAADGWETACRSPCEEWLPTGDTYRIGGSGVRESRVFSLSGSNGEGVEIAVDAASSGAFTGGIVAASIGVISLPFDLAMLSTLGTPVANGDLGPVGIVTTVVAVVLGAVGSAMFLSNARTTAVQTGVKVDATPPPVVGLRFPDWNDAPALGRIPLPSTGTTIPIFSTTF
jgi:hypothetical protein